MPNTIANYPKLVAQAEKAVSAVEDPELRRVAFEKILDDLLGAASKNNGGKEAAPRGKPPRTEKTRSKGGGPKGYVEEMVDDGFFNKPKTMAQVKAELENRGHHIPFTSLSGPLQKLCQEKVLRRQKTNSAGKKATFSYSKW